MSQPYREYNVPGRDRVVSIRVAPFGGLETAMEEKPKGTIVERCIILGKEHIPFAKDHFLTLLTELPDLYANGYAIADDVIALLTLEIKQNPSTNGRNTH